MGLGARPMAGAATARSRMGSRALGTALWWLGLGASSLALLIAEPWPPTWATLIELPRQLAVVDDGNGMNPTGLGEVT